MSLCYSRYNSLFAHPRRVSSTFRIHFKRGIVSPLSLIRNINVEAIKLKIGVRLSYFSLILIESFQLSLSYALRTNINGPIIVTNNLYQRIFVWCFK